MYRASSSIGWEKRLNVYVIVRSGPLSIATPGEIRGYWEMHKRFGSMPWRDIIQPTIEICEKGFQMTKHMSDFLHARMKENFNFR